MKIHSDVLTPEDFRTAVFNAGRGVFLEDFAMVGSRSRRWGFVFSLTGNSKHRRNFGGDGYAATWDEWGIVLAHLFLRDPNAHCGKHSYLSAEHFHWTTGNRFATLTPAQQHSRHRWSLGESNVTGTYSVSHCVCGAIQRWVLHGHSWAEICDPENACALTI